MSIFVVVLGVQALRSPQATMVVILFNTLFYFQKKKKKNTSSTFSKVLYFIFNTRMI